MQGSEGLSADPRVVWHGQKVLRGHFRPFLSVRFGLAAVYANVLRRIGAEPQRRHRGMASQETDERVSLRCPGISDQRHFTDSTFADGVSFGEILGKTFRLYPGAFESALVALCVSM